MSRKKGRLGGRAGRREGERKGKGRSLPFISDVLSSEHPDVQCPP